VERRRGGGNKAIRYREKLALCKHNHKVLEVKGGDGMIH